MVGQTPPGKALAIRLYEMWLEVLTDEGIHPFFWFNLFKRAFAERRPHSSFEVTEIIGIWRSAGEQLVKQALQRLNVEEGLLSKIADAYQLRSSSHLSTIFAPKNRPVGEADDGRPSYAPDNEPRWNDLFDNQRALVSTQEAPRRIVNAGSDLPAIRYGKDY